jgi:hypothetical protein
MRRFRALLRGNSHASIRFMQSVQSYREFRGLRISLPTAAYARDSGVAGALVEP